MDTNCAPLLACLFFYSYEAELIQKIVREKNPLTVAFNSTFRDIDDDFSVNYCYFHTNVNSIYPSEIEIQDPKDSVSSVNIRYLLYERDII